MHDYPNHLVSNADLLARAARNLRERAADTAALRELLGPAPENFQKPRFGWPDCRALIPSTVDELRLKSNWIEPKSSVP